MFETTNVRSDGVGPQQVINENFEASDYKVLDWIKDIFPDSQAAQKDLEDTLTDNPGRISRAYRALLGGYLTHPKDVIKVTLEIPEQDFTGLISSIQVPFLSFCSHHFLPYFGTVDIVYEPGPYIIGIGKMPRLVECRARRFELQETLVKHLCEDMMNYAKAKGVFVRSVARHTCVCYRGAKMYSTANQTMHTMGTLSGPARMPEIMGLLTATNM